MQGKTDRLFYEGKVKPTDRQPSLFIAERCLQENQPPPPTRAGRPQRQTTPTSAATTSTAWKWATQGPPHPSNGTVSPPVDRPFFTIDQYKKSNLSQSPPYLLNPALHVNEQPTPTPIVALFFIHNRRAWHTCVMKN